MKKIAFVVVMLSTVLVGPAGTVAQQGEVRDMQGVEVTLETPSHREQSAAPAENEVVSQSRPNAAPTVRELYIMAYLAAKRAARGVEDLEASLRALQEGVEASAAYIRQQLQRAQEKSHQPGKMESDPVPTIADSPALAESGDTAGLSVPRTEQSSVPSSSSPTADPTAAGQSSEGSTSMPVADENQPYPVWAQLKQLEERVERLERIAGLMKSADPTETQP
jgi:exonuclease VII small subunit